MNKLKKYNLIWIVILPLLSSCIWKKPNIPKKEISKIEFKAKGKIFSIDEQTAHHLIDDLNNATFVGPTKFMKTHFFYIHYKNGDIDTLYTNANIIQYKNECYRSEVNITERF